MNILHNSYLLAGILSALLLSSCDNNKSKDKSSGMGKTEASMENGEGKEYKVWKVPNVEQGAEAYFSPDSKSLIFNGKIGADSTFYVYTVNIDGTKLTKINSVGDDACSFYHPSGRSLIWTSTRDHLDMDRGNFSDPKNYPQGAEIYASLLDGSELKRLTNNSYYDAEVSYSPDGSKILFGRQINGEMDLWLMDPDGTNERQITFTPDWQEGGSFFMPDNKTIIFRAWKIEDEGKRGLPMSLFTINYNGTDRKAITSNEGTNWAPFPARDGRHIAFVKVLPPHNYEIFLKDLETGSETRLTYNEAFDGFPALSPDGKLLSFSSSRSAEPGKRELSLHLMDISELNL